MGEGAKFSEISRGSPSETYFRLCAAAIGLPRIINHFQKGDFLSTPLDGVFDGNVSESDRSVGGVEKGCRLNPMRSTHRRYCCVAALLPVKLINHEPSLPVRKSRYPVLAHLNACQNEEEPS